MEYANLDRLSFIKHININNEDLESILRLYFSQIMSMYTICKYENMDVIKLDINDNKGIKFLLCYSNSDEANIIERHINLCPYIIMHNKVYKINTTRDENTVIISLDEEKL